MQLHLCVVCLCSLSVREAIALLFLRVGCAAPTVGELGSLNPS